MGLQEAFDAPDLLHGLAVAARVGEARGTQQAQLFLHVLELPVEVLGVQAQAALLAVTG